MIPDVIGFFEPRRHDFTLDDAPDQGCHFITPALVAVGVGASTAAIAGPILAAGLGAAGSAITGGDPLQGALIGGGISALGGVTGLTGGIGGALGETGIPGLGSALGFGSSALPFGTPPSIDAAGNITSAGTPPFGTPPSIDAAGNITNGLTPLASQAATAAGGGGGGGSSKLGSIGSSLVGLAALSSLTGGGAPSSVPLPGPGSTAATQGPYFNAGLQYQTQPTRNPMNPYAGAPLSSYYTAGQRPEPTYFGNNSLLNFYTPATAPPQSAAPVTTPYPISYAARGGQPQKGALALAHGGDGSRFSTAHGQNFVRGGGDGTSDSVPAELSDGEYVLTAADVSRIGRGSNDAGAKELDKFRAELASKAGQKQFVPAKVKGALSSLRRAA